MTMHRFNDVNTAIKHLGCVAGSIVTTQDGRFDLAFQLQPTAR
jgi:hypothetical protein